MPLIPQNFFYKLEFDEVALSFLHNYSYPIYIKLHTPFYYIITWLELEKKIIDIFRLFKIVLVNNE